MLSAGFRVNPKVFSFLNTRWFTHFHTMEFQLQNHSLVYEFQSSHFEIFYEQGQIFLAELFFWTSPFFFLISISRTIGIQVWWILVKASNNLVVFTIFFYFSLYMSNLYEPLFLNTIVVDNHEQFKESRFSYSITERMKVP